MSSRWERVANYTIPRIYRHCAAGLEAAMQRKRAKIAATVQIPPAMPGTNSWKRFL